MTDKKKQRAFEMTLDIDASPEQVWQALTEARELMRWFPIEARVTPGPDGSMRWAWGDQWVWENRIDGWEPPRRLRLVQENNRPFDAKGRMLPEGRVEPARIALEFTLETHAGSTRLRVVHSGFGDGAAWDDEFDGISAGWQFEIRSLRHYLMRHFGRDRHAGRAHLVTRMPLAEAWDRLVARDGFTLDPAVPQPGRPYAVTAATGDRFSGDVQLWLPGREFFGTSSELEDGVFRLSVFRGAGETGVNVWASTYSPGAASSVRRFGEAAQDLLKRLFGGG